VALNRELVQLHPGRHLRRGDPARAARAERAPELNNPKTNRPGRGSEAASKRGRVTEEFGV
jgi:hypothetical protein